MSRNRGMQPNPETTQSCLAMIVADARSRGSTVMAVVTSLVALSSTSACSRIASIFLLFQSIRFPVLRELLEFFKRVESFLAEQGSLGRLLFQPCHNFLRSLGQKRSVIKLAFGAGELLFVLLQFFLKTLSLGCYVDLFFVVQPNGEARSRAGVRGTEFPCGCELQSGKPGQLCNYFMIWRDDALEPSVGFDFSVSQFPLRH